MFLCCGSSDASDDEDEYPRKPLQISSPTNFRRHEINIIGLDPELQDRYRRKQQEDAIAMFNDLRPLQSSPSSQFAERPATATRLTYEQFTQPRAAPSRLSLSAGQRVVSHARKLSETLTGSRKHSAGGGLVGEEDVEMRRLMEGSRTDVSGVAPPSDVGGIKRGQARGYKMSEESLDSRDDSAKGGIGKF